MDLWVYRYLRQITNDHLWPFRYCLPAHRDSEGTLAQQIPVLLVNHYLVTMIYREVPDSADSSPVRVTILQVPVRHVNQRDAIDRLIIVNY